MMTVMKRLVAKLPVHLDITSSAQDSALQL